MNALIAHDLGVVADDGRKIGDGTPDELRMSNRNAVPDLFRDLHPTHWHEAPEQVRGCGGAYVGTMNALIAHDLGVVMDDGRKIGDGTADDVRMSNRNAVPDLFRDLHPTHKHEAPAQVRGCGGAYVG
nr:MULTISPECIES: hypothetical protein [unclassified Yoonia]